MLQKWLFFQLLFLGNIGQENVFYAILSEKMPFYAIQRRSLKSRKIDIFPNRLTHGFDKKIAIFQLFFLGNIGQENVFYDILERKNAFLSYKKEHFKKSKKFTFFEKGQPMVLVQK